MCVSVSEPLVTTMTEFSVKTCNPSFNQNFTLPVKDSSTCQLEVSLWNSGEGTLDGF
jgi:hypothetical protein